MEELEKSALKGTFELETDKKFLGELTLAGSKSSLCLWGDNSFLTETRDKWMEKTVKAVLFDLGKVSLFGCALNRAAILAGGTPYERFSFRYAVFGNEYISHDEKEIIKVSFVVDDASVLFHDRGVFGEEPKVPGNGYRMFLHKGRTAIFEAKTVLGNVSAWHNLVCETVAGSSVEMKNKVSVELCFDCAVTFDDAVHRTFRVVRFLELMVGRPQNILEFLVHKEVAHEPPMELKVYGSEFPRYERLEDRADRQPYGILINAVSNPEEFSQVLASWLQRYDSRNDARGRFFAWFKKQNSYDIDRLISAANMFDILPEEAFSSDVELSDNLKSKRASKKSEVSKWKNTLRNKIRCRAQHVKKEFGDKVPDIGEEVTKTAVACRNYYVHGPGPNKKKEIDYDKEKGIHVFLTETLEFIFVASDLIEAGWKIESWYENSCWIDHPFGLYLFRYKPRLERLKTLLTERS